MSEREMMVEIVKRLEAEGLAFSVCYPVIDGRESLLEWNDSAGNDVGCIKFWFDRYGNVTNAQSLLG